jgi:hypothetical protein
MNQDLSTPVPNVYEPRNARILALLSAAAYDAKPELFDWEITPINEPSTDTRCLVCRQRQDIVIAFRGTADLKNWLTDLRCPLIPRGDGTWIHAGFADAYKSIRPQLLKATEKLMGRFWLTGHSLGAALAVLAAEDYSFFSGLYNFGQPRVGDFKFRDKWKASFGSKIFRIVHSSDIVPHVPPWVSFYRHAGHEIFYVNGDGQWKEDAPLWYQGGQEIRANIHQALNHRFAPLENHFMKNYVALYEATA